MFIKRRAKNRFWAKKPYKTQYGFRNKNYSTFKFLWLLKLKGCSTSKCVPVYADSEWEQCFYLEQLINNLKDEGLLRTAGVFNMSQVSRSNPKMPHFMGVGLTTAGSEKLTARISALATILAAILAILAILLSSL